MCFKFNIKDEIYRSQAHKHGWNLKAERWLKRCENLQTSKKDKVPCCQLNGPFAPSLQIYFLNLRKIRSDPACLNSGVKNHQPAASQRAGRLVLWYLPLPGVLDISLSVWSSFHQLNVALASSAAPSKSAVTAPRLTWARPPSAAAESNCRTTGNTKLFVTRAPSHRTSSRLGRQGRALPDTAVAKPPVSVRVFDYLCINGTDSNNNKKKKTLQGRALKGHYVKLKSHRPNLVPII